MALKFKINKSAYDALSDDMKNEYIAGDKDGEFVLDVTDIPQGEDVGPIKRALESEKAKSKTLKGDLDAAKATIAEFPDVEALKKTHEGEVGKFKTFAEKTLVEGKALELATKISTVPTLLAKTIAERIVVDTTGDVPVAKIKGADGKISDMTFDALGQEFVANKDYASIMIGSKASGGGAPKVPAKPLGGGAPKDGEQSGDKAPSFATMNPKDLAGHIRERKAAEAAASQ